MKRECVNMKTTSLKRIEQYLPNLLHIQIAPATVPKGITTFDENINLTFYYYNKPFVSFCTLVNIFSASFKKRFEV